MTDYKHENIGGMHTFEAMTDDKNDYAAALEWINKEISNNRNSANRFLMQANEGSCINGLLYSETLEKLKVSETIRRALELAADPNFVGVPREPTQVMLDAGLLCLNRGAKSCWYAMIFAATDQPSHGGRE